MTISLKTRKMLWGRSANRCSMPDCRRQLVEDESETDDPSIVGEEAHIVASEKNGPRGTYDLPADKRDYYDNLILLCNIHHKIIDDQPLKYGVEELRKIKENHINWVNLNLDIDRQKLKDDETYASYIDEWQRMVDVDNWNGWSSNVLGGGQPHMMASHLESLKKLNEYILNRVWPNRYPDLEIAFKEFRHVLNTFTNIFEKYLERHGRDETEMLRTEKIYHIDEWNPERYEALYKKFEYHVNLTEDLMLELTRSANRVCDTIRKTLFPGFRLKEGVLLITEGLCIDLTFKTKRTEYHNDNEHFNGLKDFMEIRTTRDWHYGEGISEDYFLTLE